MSVFYRGVSQAQDPRYRDGEQRTVEARAWPAFMAGPWAVAPESAEQLRLWVDERLTQLLGREDEISANFVLCALRAEPPGDCRLLWLALEPLLGAQTAAFFEGLRAAVAGLGAEGERLRAERRAAEGAERRAEVELLRGYRAVLEEYASSGGEDSPPRGRARRPSA